MFVILYLWLKESLSCHYTSLFSISFYVKSLLFLMYLWYCVNVQVCESTKLAGQKPVSAHTDNSSDRQVTERKATKEKSPSHQAAAQERIRAKLIAISVQSAAEVKKSLPSQPRDSKTSRRSPSPKRHAHVCMHWVWERWVMLEKFRTLWLYTKW